MKIHNLFILLLLWPGDNALAFDLPSSMRVEADLSDKPNLNEKDFANLPSGIFILSLERSSVLDKHLKLISRFKDLENIGLTDTKITDAGVPFLASSKKLNTIYLNGTKITGSTLSAISRLSLHTLWLDNNAIDDEGLRGICSLMSIVNLSLYSTNISDRSINCLSNLKNLESLDVSNTYITKSGYQELKKKLKKAKIEFSESLVKSR